MPAKYPAETRDLALRLLREGRTKVYVSKLLHVHEDTLRKWQHPPPKLGPRSPVRLHIERRALGDRLVLTRGLAVLEVLGVRRAGVWDLSLAGAGRAKSLLAVLPELVGRSHVVPSFAERVPEPPARPTPRMPVT